METVSLQIDERGRVTLPPKAREMLGTTAWFTMDEKTGRVYLQKPLTFDDLFGFTKDHPLGTKDLREKADDPHRNW